MCMISVLCFVENFTIPTSRNRRQLTSNKSEEFLNFLGGRDEKRKKKTKSRFLFRSDKYRYKIFKEI